MDEKHLQEFSSKTWLHNFGTGFVFCAVILVAVGSFSLWMTHQTMAEFGYIKLAIAAMIPFVAGIGAIAFPQTMKDILNAIARISDVLPF